MPAGWHVPACQHCKQVPHWQNEFCANQCKGWERVTREHFGGREGAFMGKGEQNRWNRPRSSRLLCHILSYLHVLEALVKERNRAGYGFTQYKGENILLCQGSTSPVSS